MTGENIFQVSAEEAEDIKDIILALGGVEITETAEMRATKLISIGKKQFHFY